MTKKIRLGAVLLMAVLMVVAVTTASITFAKWNAGSGGGDSGETTTYGPVAKSSDWNVYEKYFDTVPVTGGLAIVGMHDGNGEDIVIPGRINNTPVVAIYDFLDTTYKSLPVTVTIPYTVNSISPSAFANCPNLQRVYFASYEQKSDSITRTVCECGMGAFQNCKSLEKVVVYGNRQVYFGDYCFSGDLKLITAPQYSEAYIAFKNGDTDNSYYISRASGEVTITYSETAKYGSGITG